MLLVDGLLNQQDAERAEEEEEREQWHQRDEQQTKQQRHSGSSSSPFPPLLLLTHLVAFLPSSFAGNSGVRSSFSKNFRENWSAEMG